MTISVQSVHLERALEIEASSVVSAQIVGQNVVLTTAGGTVFNAGSISSVDAVASGIYPAYVADIGAFDWLTYDNLMPSFYKPGADIQFFEVPVTESLPVFELAWSPDARYLAAAVQSAGAPIVIYKRAGDVLTELTYLPDQQASSYVYSMEWSPDGQYLAVIFGSTPWVYVYKRTGDAFTKLANLTGLSVAGRVAWSPDGQILAVSTRSPATEPLLFYDRSGDVFTKRTGMADLPTSLMSSITWTPDGEYFVGTQVVEGLVIFKRTGGSLSRIPNAAGPAFSSASGATWTPDGQHLAVVSNETTPRVTIFKRTGSAIAHLSEVVVAPGGVANDGEWSPDGQYLAVGLDGPSNTSDVAIFKRSGDTLTYIPEFPNVNESFNSLAITWSPDNVFLTVGWSQEPYLGLFKSAMLTPPGEPTST